MTTSRHMILTDRKTESIGSSIAAETNELHISVVNRQSVYRYLNGDEENSGGSLV
jgi:hypothetical protein